MFQLIFNNLQCVKVIIMKYVSYDSPYPVSVLQKNSLVYTLKFQVKANLARVEEAQDCNDHLG